MTDPQFFQELVLRAPNPPEWFQPKGFENNPRPPLFGKGSTPSAIDESMWERTQWEGQFGKLWEEQRLAQWPSFYAASVIDAMPKEGEKQQKTPSSLRAVFDTLEEGDVIHCRGVRVRLVIDQQP